MSSFRPGAPLVNRAGVYRTRNGGVGTVTKIAPELNGAEGRWESGQPDWWNGKGRWRNGLTASPYDIVAWLRPLGG